MCLENYLYTIKIIFSFDVVLQGQWMLDLSDIKLFVSNADTEFQGAKNYDNR